MREYAKKPENQSRTLDSNPRASKQAPISQILQTYRNRTLGEFVQRQEIDENELLQPKLNVAQREKFEEEELLQGKFESTLATEHEPVQREGKPNNTGLPDNLKSSIESLSGCSMDDVRVHYNSSKPTQLQALAYTQGTDIHVAPSQEEYLPHEAWHVVQQKQGRVQPTMQMQGVDVNDNEGLEKEVNEMGKQIFETSLSIVNPCAKEDQTAQSTHNYPSQQVIQMVRYVIRATGDIEEVEDDYQIQLGEEFLTRLQEAEYLHHQYDMDRVRRLQEAKDKGPIIIEHRGFNSSSATQNHLNTPFIDKDMKLRKRLKHGVEFRYLRPTSLLAVNDGRLRREISPEQVEKYKAIQTEVIRNEIEKADDYYAFYHAQDPRMRVAQDVYKRVYARYYKKEIPEDFHFFRFPGPEDNEFRTHENVQSFFEEDMATHGMIDDNMSETKTHLISVNPALHSGLGHAGEETFHYFQIGQGQTELPIAKFMQTYLEKFGLNASGADELYAQASVLNSTKEGSLFQIMVPKELVDKVAYMAHPHGLPYDDELLDNFHLIGDIRYRRVNDKIEREKMNDEITRKLKDMREAWSSIGEPESRLKTRTKELHDRMIARFQNGDYRPSLHLENFIHYPEKFQHPEGHAQKLRMEMNPEHFRGQGLRSKHEIMRIQNRSTFMQARLHLSVHHALNPESGIWMKRFTTMEPDNEKAYNELLDRYVNNLFNK